MPTRIRTWKMIQRANQKKARKEKAIYILKHTALFTLLALAFMWAGRGDYLTMIGK